jgi:DNA-directed RNA polymerase specialized sigma24 family protein
MPRGNATVRERVLWTPSWSEEIEGYTANFIRTNSWRLDRLDQFQDAMQDAFLIFWKCKETYPRVIEARHFMALYKRALINSTHDKASRRKRRDAVEVLLDVDAIDFYAGRIGETTNAGYAAALLAELPEELRFMLNKLAQGLPQEPVQPKTRGLKPRESLTMQLRRIFRLPINSDPLQIIKRLLTN